MFDSILNTILTFHRIESLPITEAVIRLVMLKRFYGLKTRYSEYISQN